MVTGCVSNGKWRSDNRSHNVSPTCSRATRGTINYDTRPNIQMSRHTNSPCHYVAAVLKAAKDSDVAGFKNAYSKEIREDKGQRDWQKNLKEAQVNTNKEEDTWKIDER
jgi:hypothetical protein